MLSPRYRESLRAQAEGREGPPPLAIGTGRPPYNIMCVSIITTIVITIHDGDDDVDD